MTGSAAIVVIGNEVLEGSTTDTNSGWLCRQISGRGGRILQICTVPDDQERIIDALARSFALGANLVVTIGGLGSTRDDRTAAAISAYARVPMLPHETAIRLVGRRYEQLAQAGAVERLPSAETNRARAKMTLLPDGAEAIPNEAGVAPAIHLTVAGGGILALPGVPRELKHIVADQAGDVFQRWLGAGHLRGARVVTSTSEESVLDSALQEFDAQGNDGVYLKSRARHFGKDVRMTVTLSARGTDLDRVRRLLRSSLELFRQILDRRGIEIVEVDFDPPEQAPLDAAGRKDPIRVVEPVPSVPAQPA
ncbi:competence/damage-inducible protein A [Amycolatopsis sp. NPDC059021]|uniref:competence/damage-inducible protein A n=1 Tax=Amycolatopsis sp. NPDC059021 TaxID=3346704 RepID=UPI00366A83E7